MAARHKPGTVAIDSDGSILQFRIYWDPQAVKGWKMPVKLIRPDEHPQIQLALSQHTYMVVDSYFGSFLDTSVHTHVVEGV